MAVREQQGEVTVYIEKKAMQHPLVFIVEAGSGGLEWPLVFIVEAGSGGLEWRDFVPAVATTGCNGSS